MSEVIEAAVATLAEKDTSAFEGSAKFVIEGEGSHHAGRQRRTGGR